MPAGDTPPESAEATQGLAHRERGPARFQLGVTYAFLAVAVAVAVVGLVAAILAGVITAG